MKKNDEDNGRTKTTPKKNKEKIKQQNRRGLKEGKN